MESLLRDVRFGLKLLIEERTLSATVLLTLAICLGANVAIFGVIHTVLLEPLPFPDSDRLVSLYNNYPGAGAPRGSNGTVDFFERRENVQAFEEVALYQGSGSTVGDPGAAERLSTMRVTPSFFAVLGVQAALGRTFTEDEMEPGNEYKVLLSDGYWEQRFARAPDVVGRDLRVDGRAREIVGVLPADFRLPTSSQPRLYLPVPLGPEDRDIDNWHSNNFSMMARLRPGATVEQARAQNEALNQALIDASPMPNARQILADAGYHTEVVRAHEDLVRDVEPILYMLWAGVGLVLLIGCVNVANLMLARAQTRTTEVATKLALGAPRGRIARQVLTEAVVMGVVGGALGVGLGALGLELLTGMAGGDLPRGTEIGLDGTVLLFTLALAVGAGALFGAIPIAQIMRSDLAPVFRAEGRTGTASRRSVLLRSGLVTGQVALAFVLLIGAGLMLMSFRAALSVDPGFEPEGVMTGLVSLPSARYPDGAARRRFWDELLTDVRALPVVASASTTNQLPFSGSNSSNVMFPEGYVAAPGESLLAPALNVVGPAYFESLEIELLAGRAFDDRDGPGSVRVAVIDEWLARRYWPEQSPLGDRIAFGVVPGTDSVPESNLATVVGVVRTIKQLDLTAPASEHVGAYYFPYGQQTPSAQALVVRTSGDPAAITPALRDVVARLDPELPLYGTQTMASRIDESLAGRRVPLVLLGVFAVVALFLAVVGIYGALAYSVTQRRREIGIRMAMGSAPATVFGSVVGQGMRVTGLGLVAGAVAAWFLTRLIESLLFGVAPTDPRVIGGVAALLAAVGLVACIVPARNATAVDPMSALGS